MCFVHGSEHEFNTIVNIVDEINDTIWNALDDSLKTCNYINSFKRKYS